MDWKKLLAYITGLVDQELLLRNEYLVTERHRGGVGRPVSQPVPHPRSGREILPRLLADHRRGRSEARTAPAMVSQLECLC